MQCHGHYDQVHPHIHLTKIKIACPSLVLCSQHDAMTGHYSLVTSVLDELILYASGLGSLEQRGQCFAVLEPSTFNPPSGFYASDHITLLCFDIVQIASVRPGAVVQYPSALGAYRTLQESYAHINDSEDVMVKNFKKKTARELARNSWTAPALRSGSWLPRQRQMQRKVKLKRCSSNSHTQSIVCCPTL